MASFTPYTYIQCPCYDTSISSPLSETSRSADEEEEHTFDPRAPRANYNLYPLEHLLYCEDCHEIKCPRCVLEEILTWYCPSCLFEVPSSSVKSEGTRCTRSCFQCPSCTSPLSVSSTGVSAELSPTASSGGAYVLNCPFCQWSSKEIGIQLEKPNSVFGQLAKIKNGGDTYITPKERRREQKREISDVSEESRDSDITLDPNEKLDAESHFMNLKTFYQSQLNDNSSGGGMAFSGDYGYGSPGALSRIMGLYTGGSFVDKKSKAKTGNMREASDALEGLQISNSSSEAAITQLCTSGWEVTASAAQRKEQAHSPRFLSNLRPIATLLRTKRSKRCKTCRHILSKPESKVTNTRFRIRLVALNYIPSIAIKPLQASSAPQPQPLLTPLKPTQFLLTFKNPLFERVRVNIATPAATPGRFSTMVTVLCPQFEVGANTDVWDEALRESSSASSDPSAGREKKRSKTEAAEGQHQAEAGKVWESGRNWVSVVVEVVPPSLRMDGPAFLQTEAQKKDQGPLREGEDVVEIPVFVRVEWEADAQVEEGGLGGGGKGEGREKRELAYWCVLGVGKVARD